MCAIIGLITNDEIDQSQKDLLKKVFCESKIRGLHATGISWIELDKIQTEKLPVGGDVFSEKFDFDRLKGNLFIGHCRYSTSDLEYNQPISNERLSIVHNGVVTQEAPENWKEHFGGSYLTKNDTEIFFNCWASGENPFVRLPKASGAVLTLEMGKLTAFRNGKRPAWLTKLYRGWLITSTADISRRCGFQPDEMLKLGQEYRFNSKSINLVKTFEGEDWQ